MNKLYFIPAILFLGIKLYETEFFIDIAGLAHPVDVDCRIVTG